MTVLGKSSAMPDAGGANSGYLLSHEGFKLLVDCGNGVFAKLREHSDPAEVDVVLITHLHPDHVLDLYPFSHALTYHSGRSVRRPLLWAPPGAAEAFATAGAVFGAGSQVSDAFTLTEYDPVLELVVGPLTIVLREVPHFVRTWACDVRSEDGRRFTYGADCGPSDAIVALARDTDLLMLEATEGAGPHQGGGFRGHMTAEEAGGIGRRAAAKRLLLTHYSDKLDAAALRHAAEEQFGGPVELAAAAARYTV